MNSNAHAPLRRCFLEPVPEIFEAASLLKRAAKYHLKNDSASAAACILAADIPEIGLWTEAIKGKIDPAIHQMRTVPSSPARFSKTARIPERMPTPSQKKEVLERDGFNCRFCGIPVVEPIIRKAMQRLYPQAVRWGSRKGDHHTALEAMWLQFDHVLPHSRGGSNETSNILITCLPCNYGRNDSTLEEVGLIDPRGIEIRKSDWDGLREFRLKR